MTALSHAEIVSDVLPALGYGDAVKVADALARSATRGRYEVSLSIGAISDTTRTDDLDAATEKLERFSARHRGRKDAHGGVYDLHARKPVANWTGRVPSKPRTSSPADIFGALIADGQPVIVATECGRVEFNR